MLGATYPAARLAAPRIHEHFARHLTLAAASGAGLAVADPPSAEDIEALISAAFWASLRREEGYVPRVSLAYLGPDQTTNPMVFERALPLHAATLTKVAPAVERAGIHLGVWPTGHELMVWGTTRTIPHVCFVLEVSAPGVLVVKHHRADEAGKFFNVAVLEGDQVKVIDEQSTTSYSETPALVSSLLGLNAGELAGGSTGSLVDVFVELAVSMRAHGRGGALLVVPDGSDTWRESVVRPMPYAVSPPFAQLAQLQEAPSDRGLVRAWRDDLGRAVATVAGLTAVDGATILTTDYRLLAFGAKLTRRRGSTPVERILVTEPIDGWEAMLAEPVHLGGTRHLSAAQFVHDQHDAVALVASQDGRFTVFAWSSSEGRVHAHRVEALLL